jgi:hypothetical protein
MTCPVSWNQFYWPNTFPSYHSRVCVKAYREYRNFKEYNKNFWPALKFVGTTYHSRLARPDWGHFPQKIHMVNTCIFKIKKIVDPHTVLSKKMRWCHWPAWCVRMKEWNTNEVSLLQLSLLAENYASIKFGSLIACPVNYHEGLSILASWNKSHPIPDDSALADELPDEEVFTVDIESQCELRSLSHRDGSW